MPSSPAANFLRRNNRRKRIFADVITAFFCISVFAFAVVIILPIYRMMTFDPVQHIESQLSEAEGRSAVEVWAASEIAKNDPRSNAVLNRDVVAVPDSISKHGVNWAMFLPGQNNGQPTTLLYAEFGGGFHHFGLVFGAGDVPPDNSGLSGSFVKWDDGIWFRNEAIN